MNSTRKAANELVHSLGYDKDGFTTCDPSMLIQRIDDMLRQREQEVRAEERERCAKLICQYCAQGVEIDADGDHVWSPRDEGGHKIQQWEPCIAAAIRRDDTPQEGEQS